MMSIVTCRSHQAPRGAKTATRPTQGPIVHYIGGLTGQWRIADVKTHSGLPLHSATHVQVVSENLGRLAIRSAWVLRTIVRNTRFVACEELPQSQAGHFCAPTGDASCAALILIRNSPFLGEFPNDDQRESFEEQLPRTRDRMRFLPAITRRWSRGINLDQPFDSVTWFEYSPQDASFVDELIGVIHASRECQFAEREIIMKLERDSHC